MISSYGQLLCYLFQIFQLHCHDCPTLKSVQLLLCIFTCYHVIPLAEGCPLAVDVFFHLQLLMCFVKLFIHERYDITCVITNRIDIVGLCTYVQVTFFLIRG